MTRFIKCAYNLCCLIKTDDDELQVLVLQDDVEDVTNAISTTINFIIIGTEEICDHNVYIKN